MWGGRFPDGFIVESAQRQNFDRKYLQNGVATPLIEPNRNDADTMITAFKRRYLHISLH